MKPNKPTRKTKRPAVFAPAALGLCLSILGAGGANAQQAAGNKAVPPLGAARPLALPKVVEDALPNGMRLVLLEDHTQPALWLRLALPAGSIRDPKSKTGLASLTAQMLTKGTAGHSEAQIADTVDGLGASLDASAGEDFLSVSANGLSAYADTLFNLLADVTLNPTFPAQELERTRLQTVNNLTASLARPATIADAVMSRLVYGAHPYGNFASGTPATLSGLTRDDLTKFHDTYFAPNQATLFLVGDITPAQARAHAQAVFGSWAKKDVPPAPAPPAKLAVPAATAKPQITLIDRPGAAQTEVRIGTLTSGYNDPNRYVGSVATAVLGLGQFEGRLMQEIRVKRGLTYGASSYFQRNKDAGEFEISTYTKNASTGEVVKLALEEARKISMTEPGAEELQDRKTFLQGSFAVSVATPTGVLTRLVPAVLYGGGPSDLTHYTERIQSVTGSQASEIIRNLHLNAPQIVLVGDAKTILKDLQEIGAVRVIPASIIDLQSPTLLGATGAGNGGDTGGTGAAGAGNSGGAKATPAESAEGKSRLAATIKAHGGDAFLNVKSMTLKGKGEISDPTGQLPGALPVETLTLVIASPDKVRADLAAGVPIAFGTAGAGSGEWLSLAGSIQDAPAGVSSAVNPIKLLRDAYTQNYAVRALPKAENGQTAYSVTQPDGRTINVYVDPVTNLAARMVLPAKSGDVTVVLGNYKNTQGVQLPGTLKVIQGKTTFLNLTFTDFAINGAVDNAIFARPKS